MEEIVTTESGAAAEAVEVSATDSVLVSEAAPKKKQRKPINQQKLQDNLWGWAFCLPLIVGTVLFVYIALFIALVLSFANYNASLSEASVWEFIGKIFSGDRSVYMNNDPLYWYKSIFSTKPSEDLIWKTTYNSLWAKQNGKGVVNGVGYTLFNTVFYLVGIPIGMVLSMFFAVCMSRDIKGGNVFRVLYYIPCVASTIAIVYTFKILFNVNGLINQMFGSKGLPWLKVNEAGSVSELGANGSVNTYWTQGMLSKLVVVIMAVWKGLGGTIILYVAGLSGVNAATKEAAQIDGANGWTIFWKVTMPDLYPVIFYNIVTAVIGGMQIYAEPELFFGSDGSGVDIMTAGYVSLIWYYGLRWLGGNNSLGAAFGMVLAVIILVLTLFQFWLDKRNKD